MRRILVAIALGSALLVAAGDELLLQLVSQATAQGSGAVVGGDFTLK